MPSSFDYSSFYSHYIPWSIIPFSPKTEKEKKKKKAMTSPPPELILTSSPDGPITAYDASTGETIIRFASSRSPSQGLTLAGQAFIAASHVSPVTGLGSIRLYNWWSSTALHSLPMPEPVAPLTATPDGSFLFAGGLSGSVYALSVPSGDILSSLPAHTKPVSCLAISNDESLLISGGYDGTIVVTPIFPLVGSEKEATNQLIMHKFGAHSGAITAIASGKGFCNSQVISSSSDCTCKFWSLLSGTHIRTVEFPCPILGIILNPLESEFYAAGSDGSVYREPTRVRSRKVGGLQEGPMRWAQHHGSSVVSLGMVKGGRNLVSGSEDGSIWVRRADDGQVVLALGTEMGNSISDLVVANGIGRGKEPVLRLSNVTGFCRDKEVTNSGFRVKEMMDIEDVLAVTEHDKSRAIDTLESAIATHERLLELILKEAKQKNGQKDGDINC